MTRPLNEMGLVRKSVSRRGASKPSLGEFVDRQEHQRLIVLLGQGRTDLGAFGRRHAAVQDQRVDAVWLEGFCELVEVFDAVGQGQAAPAAPGGIGDVCRDQMVAAWGEGEFVVDGLDGCAVGARLIGREVRGVHDEVFGEGAGVFDLVADRPALHGDHWVHLVGAVGGCRQADPPRRLRSADRGFGAGRPHGVALVHDDQSVAVE